MTVDQLQYVHGIRTVKSPICNKIYPPPFFPKSDLPNNFKINIVERVKIDTPNRNIHDRSRSWLATDNFN